MFHSSHFTLSVYRKGKGKVVPVLK